MRKFFSTLFILIALASFSVLIFLGADRLKAVNDDFLFKKQETISVVTSPVSLQEKKKVVIPVPDKPVRPKISVPETKPLPVKIPEPVIHPVSVPLVHDSQTTKTIETLTEGEVLQWTNQYRRDNGLSPLSKNTMLDSMAFTKASDMLALQYFAHESPLGKDVSGLAKDAGYAYLLVGENLAYGDFSDAKDLVDNWMASPGHRANILKSDYKEIGISVIFGKYQGYNVWMAVQEFGRPASDCPLPTEIEKAQIDIDTVEVEALKSQINTMKAQMDILNNERRYEEFNALVTTYNDLVVKINALSGKITEEVNMYNAGIQTYKACVGQ